MDLAAWVRQWLSAHPLKEHSRGDRARYTAEVMERVRTLGQPATAPRPVARWFAWPQVSLATAAVAAAVFMVVGRMEYPMIPLADQVDHDVQVLAAVAETNVVMDLAADDLDTLAEDLEALDTLVLAEAQSVEEQWLEETLWLLQEVGDDGPPDAAGETSEEPWLDELELLDEFELTAAS